MALGEVILRRYASAWSEVCAGPKKPLLEAMRCDSSDSGLRHKTESSVRVSVIPIVFHEDAARCAPGAHNPPVLILQRAGSIALRLPLI